MSGLGVTRLRVYAECFEDDIVLEFISRETTLLRITFSNRLLLTLTLLTTTI
jgi:hypothetical protein